MPTWPFFIQALAIKNASRVKLVKHFQVPPTPFKNMRGILVFYGSLPLDPKVYVNR